MRSSTKLLLWLCLPLAATLGCGDDRATVEGKVLLDGQPLPYGSVMFQPPHGQPARADIRPDGTFTLQSPEGEEGTPVGLNRVRVSSYTTQDPQTQAEAKKFDQELPLGKSLIPKQYTDFATSGITVDVKPNMAPVELNLNSKPQAP